MIQTTTEPIVPCTNSKPIKLPNNFHPRSMDILCGRGRGVWEHQGNRRFKALIDAHSEKYTSARTKIDKGAVIAALVDSIRATGVLFVKKDATTDSWIDIGEYQAREKTSHAMRDHINKRRSTMKNDTQQSIKYTRVMKQHMTHKVRRNQQPTTQGLATQQDVQGHPDSVLSSLDSGSFLANTSCKRLESETVPMKMAPVDIFHKLGLDYLSLLEHETTGTQSTIYADPAPSQHSSLVIDDMIAEDGDEEALQWSELFPVGMLDRMRRTSFAFAS